MSGGLPWGSEVDQTVADGRSRTMLFDETWRFRCLLLRRGRFQGCRVGLWGSRRSRLEIPRSTRPELQRLEPNPWYCRRRLRVLPPLPIGVDDMSQESPFGSRPRLPPREPSSWPPTRGDRAGLGGPPCGAPMRRQELPPLSLAAPTRTGLCFDSRARPRLGVIPAGLPCGRGCRSPWAGALCTLPRRGPSTSFRRRSGGA